MATPNGRSAAPTSSPGALLSLIREGRASTRSELAALTGLGRSTVSQRMDTLLERRLIVPAGDLASTGGRPPKSFVFNRDAGVVLCADLGASHARVAVTDLAGELLGETVEDRAIADGPEPVLDWLERTWGRLLAGLGRSAGDVRGVGVGLPGPVEFAAGRPVTPPIMPGWNGYPVADRLRDRFGAPVLVDNDVNIMALGEHRATWPAEDHLLFVKVATGIGAGIISNGRLHRGAQGTAGDIGHVHVPDHDDQTCHCGNHGCLEAVASGSAMAAQLTALGTPAAAGRDVVSHVHRGSTDAARVVRQAGRELGGVLSGVVNLFNPGVIVIGGAMAHADDHLLAGVSEVVYRRSTPLATRGIRVVRSSLDDRAGITGAAVMVLESVLAPDAVDAALATAAER